MMPEFNLVDEPWIPCTFAAAGEVRLLGIRDTLVRAHEIREISDPAPPVTAALHRLLLAILHRNFGPRDASAWADLWREGRWDKGVLTDYFEEWRNRFDLFSADRPFYQVASIAFPDKPAPATKLAHEIASPGNAVLLFDHTTDGILPPNRAARYLLAYQAYAPGGTVSRGPGEGPSADAAPLTKGAVMLVKAENLFRTLMLNLHCYSPEDAEPFESKGEDVPAWEREREPVAGDRYPHGYLDLLTWQSRRIRLQPEECETERIQVRNVIIMKGEQFPDNWERHKHETMVAFRKLQKPIKGQEPWPAVTFWEEKAVWRDSLSLFEMSDNRHVRPKMLDWIADLVSQGALTRSKTIPIDVLGMSTDRASVLFWRHERLPLPLSYLNDRELLDALKLALRLAEDLGAVVYGTTRSLAELLLAPNSDQPNARKPDRKDVTNLVTALAAERAYWSRLEVPFERLLVRLPGDRPQGEDGGSEYGTVLLPEWADTLRRTARDAFVEAASGLEGSGRTLKALALAQRELNRRLSGVLRGYLPEREEVRA